MRHQAIGHIIDAGLVGRLPSADSLSPVELPEQCCLGTGHMRKEHDVATRRILNGFENDTVDAWFAAGCQVFSNDLRGQIFFSSSEKFMQGFDFKEDVKEVIIDLTHSHIWDVTSVAMLDSVVNKFQKNGANVTVRGLNEASSIMIDKYGTHARI